MSGTLARDSVPTLFYRIRASTDAVVMTQGAVSCIAFHPSDPDLVLGRRGGRVRGCRPLLLEKIICRLEHAPTYDEDEEAGALS